MLAVQQAEMNRDVKKRKKPYSIEEFCFYGQSISSDMPDSRYGAAAKALLDRKMFPYWALFVYKDLVGTSDMGLPPIELALIGDDCIILAPNYVDNECFGMLIAQESASNTVREMQSTSGDIVTIRMPIINNKVVAIEDSRFRIIR